jgi:hypothetical protein
MSKVAHVKPDEGGLGLVSAGVSYPPQGGQEGLLERAWLLTGNAYRIYPYTGDVRHLS